MLFLLIKQHFLQAPGSALEGKGGCSFSGFSWQDVCQYFYLQFGQGLVTQLKFTISARPLGPNTGQQYKSVFFQHWYSVEQSLVKDKLRSQTPAERLDNQGEQ